jgi:hypothetical protein
MLGKKLKNKVIGGIKTGPIGGGGSKPSAPAAGGTGRGSTNVKPYMAEGGRVKKKCK